MKGLPRLLATFAAVSGSFLAVGVANASASDTLSSALNGKCLDITDGNSGDGASVSMYDCTGSSNQLWSFLETTSAGFEVVSALNGKCLDITDANSGDGASVSMYDCTGSTNQAWSAGAQPKSLVLWQGAGTQSRKLPLAAAFL